MSDHLGSQQTIRTSFNSELEVVTPQLEKIQFTNSGEANLSRPDKLRVHRVGGYADVAPCFGFSHDPLPENGGRTGVPAVSQTLEM